MSFFAGMSGSVRSAEQTEFKIFRVYYSMGKKACQEKSRVLSESKVFL